MSVQRKSQIAFSRMLLPDGRTLRNEVVVLDAEGYPISHFPLISELPFVEWRDATYVYGDTNQSSE